MKVTTSRVGLPALASLPTRTATRRIVNTVFRREKATPRGSVNVIFVDTRTIRRLNKKFLDTSGDTDVIAFPYDIPPGRLRDFTFGDIYVSVPVAKDNAQRFGEPIRRELTRLIVHGVLHLLGYSDHGRLQKEKMWKRQELLTNILCAKMQR